MLTEVDRWGNMNIPRNAAFDIVRTDMNDFDAYEIVTNFLERLARNSRYSRLTAICDWLRDHHDNLDAVQYIVDDNELEETGLTREDFATAIGEARENYNYDAVNDR